MAEMANTLAFSAYNQQAALYSNSMVASPTQQNASKDETNPRDRDSGVFLSDNEDSLPQSNRSSVVSLKHSPSTTSPTGFARTDSTRTTTGRRLQRPAELNLGAGKASDSPKPKSELEMRYDMIRNSQTQSRAALKSPTQLLQDRLNLSPKKKEHQEKIRIFTPPRPMLNGCILPGPEKQMEAFIGKDVRAKTEKGRPAWWCKFDKLVVFDGVEESEDGDVKFQTRTSKGLSIARRRGDLESILIPLDCSHCRDMLNRSEWKYDIQVCKRSVCWDCKERCKWEMEEEKKPRMETENTAEANRERADSVLQDQQVQEEDLMRKVGIEIPPKSPIEAVGGIEERLEKT